MKHPDSCGRVFDQPGERDLDLVFLPIVEGEKHLQMGLVWGTLCKTSLKSAS